MFAVLMIAVGLYVNAQSVQYGYTEEYRGTKEKKPLSGVNINAGGATTKSGSDGKFKLEFNTLKIGDRINADIQNVATLKGYVLFNRVAVEQWTVSGKDTYFRIVLCKKKTFDDLVMTYYNVSDKSYREQLRKEREFAAELKRKGEIQQREYEKMLREADDRYNNAFKRLRENAELVARIDESELEGDQREILRLAKEGRLDEAVGLIKKGNTIELFAKALSKGEYATGQQEYFAQKEAEAKAEMKSLAAKLKTNIKILQLAGGKENMDLCGEYWQKIIAADTTDFDNVTDGAKFFYNQTDYELAEKYYLIELALASKHNTTETGRFEYARALNNLGDLYIETYKYEEAEKYLVQAMNIFKSLVESNLDMYADDYATSLDNLAVLYTEMEKYDKVEEYQLKGLEMRKDLSEKNPEKYLEDYASSLTNMGNFYSDVEQYAKSEECQLKSLYIRKALAEKNPVTYNPDLAMSLHNLGYLYLITEQYKKSEEYALQAMEIRKKLVNKNPDAYNPNYASTLNLLGAAYQELEQHDKEEEFFVAAMSIYKKLAENNPRAYERDYAMVLSNLGLLYTAIKQYDKAEKCFIPALQIRKSWAERYPEYFHYSFLLTAERLNEMYKASGQYEKAVDNFLQIISFEKELAEKEPETFMGYYASYLNDLGIFYISMKQNDNAKKYFLQSIDAYESMAEKIPEKYAFDYAMTLINLIELYKNENMYEKCEESYTKVLAVYADLASRDPGKHNDIYAKLLNNCGNMYKEMKRYDKAEGYASQALAIFEAMAKENPEGYNQFCALARNNLWEICICTKRFAESEMHVRKVLETDPTTTWAKANLAIALLLQGKYDEAKTIALEAVGEDPKMKEGFVEDLKAFDEMGVIPEERKSDVERFKQAIANVK